MRFLVSVGGGVSGPGDPFNLITLLFQNGIGNSSAKMVRKNITGRAVGGVATPPLMITTPHVCTKHFFKAERNFRHGNGQICISQTRAHRLCGERKRYGIRPKAGKFALVKQETIAYAGKEKDTGYDQKMHRQICISQTRDHRLYGERKRYGIRPKAGKFALVKQEIIAYAGKDKDTGCDQKMHRGGTKVPSILHFFDGSIDRLMGCLFHYE